MKYIKDKDIIIGYSHTISGENKKIFQEIVKDFLTYLKGLNNFTHPLFPVKIDDLKVKDFLEKKMISENNFMRLKFSGSYRLKSGKDNQFERIELKNSRIQKDGIYWNLDTKMRNSKDKPITDDTIHSEISLISDFRNQEYSGISSNDIFSIVLSTRPCINCAKALVTFHNEIKQINGKGISHIFLARNDLYLNNDIKTTTVVKYKTKEFQIVLEKLLNAGMRVYIYTDTSNRKYINHEGCKYFYKLFIDGISINTLNIRELSYEHITELYKFFNK